MYYSCYCFTQLCLWRSLYKTSQFPWIEYYWIVLSLVKDIGYKNTTRGGLQESYPRKDVERQNDSAQNKLQ